MIFDPPPSASPFFRTGGRLRRSQSSAATEFGGVEESMHGDLGRLEDLQARAGDDGDGFW